MNAVAVIVAAGASRRMAGIPKMTAPVAGRPLLAWTLSIFDGSAQIAGIVVVGPAENPEILSPCLEGVRTPWRLVAGGSQRQASVALGLAACAPAAPAVAASGSWPRVAHDTRVAIHDGARPGLSPQLLAAVLRRAAEAEGALPVMPLADTIKEVSGGVVIRTLDRTGLWAAQTPQVFPWKFIQDAHARAAAAGFAATDDAQLAEWAGGRVVTVEGNPENMKVTTPDDLALVESHLRLRRAAV